MSFFDKIKDIMSATDEDEEFEEFAAGSSAREVPSGNDYYSSSSSRSYDREKTTQFPSERKSKGSVSRVNSQLQVALVKPERFEDVPAIADHLADGRTGVLNLEAANRETQRRLLDFLSGAAYAHGGRIKKVANSTFIITPSNVDVMGELLIDELEGSNTYF